MPSLYTFTARSLLGLSLLLGCSDGPGHSATGDAGPQSDVPGMGTSVPPPSLERLGTPGWTIHCAQSSYPAPTDSAGYQRATGRFIAQAVSPEHTTRAPGYGVLPGAAHDQPYHDEPQRFLQRAGAAPRAEFIRNELDAQGSHIVFCALVPSEDAPRGVTEDGASQPMLPASLFPLAVTHRYRAGPSEIGPYLEGYPVPVNGVQGMSHVVLRWAQQFAFEPGDVFPLSMSFELIIRDAGGNGYRVTLPFRATDPGA